MALRPLLVLSLIPVALLAGCLPGRAPETRGPAPAWVASPNGEPLPFRAGQEDCRGALAAWLARADGNGDGVVDMAEMQADAARWFAAADLDHDGQITADELTTVRQRLLPQAEPEPEAERAPPGRPRVGRPQARLDPVMQADANADFRVSAQEFRDHVAARFADLARDGALDQTQLFKACGRSS